LFEEELSIIDSNILFVAVAVFSETRFTRFELLNVEIVELFSTLFSVGFDLDSFCLLAF
jgi:hypothetical protein